MGAENARARIVEELKRHCALAGGSVDLCEFLAAYHAGCSEERLRSRPAATLHQHGRALFEFGARREAGEIKVRCHRDAAAAGGSLVVLETVTGDMPHIVESVVARLRAQNLLILDIIHPVVPVRRDAAGCVAAVGPAVAGWDADAWGAPESFIRIEVDGAPDLAEDELADAIRAVIERLRLVNADKEAAHALLDEARAEVPAAAALLDWLGGDLFTPVAACAVSAEAGALAVGHRHGLFRRVDCGALADGVWREADRGRALPVLVTKLPLLSPITGLGVVDCVAVWSGEGDARRVWIVAGHISAAQSVSPFHIPMVADKVQAVMTALAAPAQSHNGRLAALILEEMPRDDLVAASPEWLAEAVETILDCEGRHRTALLVLHHPLDHFVSVQVHLPSAHFDRVVRERIARVLEDRLRGVLVGEVAVASRGANTRLHLLLAAPSCPLPAEPAARSEAVDSIRRVLADVVQPWNDRLRRALAERVGEAEAARLWRRYAAGFPAEYRERYRAQSAAEDVEAVETALSDGLSVRLHKASGPGGARVKVCRAGGPVHLYRLLPMLENMGGRVVDEASFQLAVAGGPAVWLHDIGLELGGMDLAKDGDPVAAEPRFAALFRDVWHGVAENDGFNRLLFAAGLDGRAIAILRAYAQYLKQAGMALSQGTVERALAAHPAVAAALIAYFEHRFRPGAETAPNVLLDLLDLLDGVSGSEDDRVLRRLFNLIEATLRTNAFQDGDADEDKRCLAFKFDSARVEDLPEPRPVCEIFVTSSRVEGIHLRGAKVARGGLRWSDRPEDYRTEALGLLKAQMVKNAAIVPAGAKGGFVVKRRTAGPSLEDRQARFAEAVECYKIFVGALLDLTDNIVGDGLGGGRVVPPPATVRHDGDDPYLVVAADKGTAGFSDIANAVAQARGFWLGDAFASGGSAGYDHKAMGITARGAWVGVQRHFRELGHDVQTTPFTVAGVGDMSGDVFGNGMLRSSAIRLVAAFNHEFIFVDPTPDPLASWAERERLFHLPASNWNDYDRAALSAGGGVFRRDAKSIALSEPARRALGLDAPALRPDALVRAILAAPVDLLYFGGPGTYVRASDESDAAVGDRANDSVRLTAARLRARVVAEGVTRALTQAARIEYALGGGRINTDAIDTSAGVDCADREVNIKILLAGVGGLDVEARNALLRAMTDEVGTAVLRNSHRQTGIISVIEAAGVERLDRLHGLMRFLERERGLDRGLERLPDEVALAQRQHRGLGLTRPEIAVLLAHGKNWLARLVEASDLPDDPHVLSGLPAYFPQALGRRFPGAVDGHRLARDILATVLANDVVDWIGADGVLHLAEREGCDPAAVVRAFVAVRDTLHLAHLLHLIDGEDGVLAASVQYELLAAAARVIEEAMVRVLRTDGPRFALGPAVERSRLVAEALFEALADVDGETGARLAERVTGLRGRGVPTALAEAVARLEFMPAVWNIGAVVAGAASMPLDRACRIYLRSGARFGLEWLRVAARRVPVGDFWHRRAVADMVEDLTRHQRALTAQIIALGSAGTEDPFGAWVERNADAVVRMDRLVAELKTAGPLNVAMLAVANREISSIVA